MKNLLVFAVVGFAFQSASYGIENASSLPPSASIRQMAIEETAIVPTEVKDRPTDVSVSGGMLSLKDNKPEVRLRSWDYFLALSAQSFAPVGNATNDYGTQFNLNGNSTTVMPAVALGFTKTSYKNDSLNAGWGLGAKAGYASQNAAVTLPSGYLIDDARLNSTLLSLNPFLHVNFLAVSWFDAHIGYLIGTLSYAETSTDDFAKFSRQATFQGWNLGADFRLNQRWSVLLDYSYKALNSASNDIGIQNNNLELGTRVTW